MPTPVHESQLLTRLRDQAQSLGLQTRVDGPDGMAGEVESIRSKWFLGGRKVTYRMRCHLETGSHRVRCREAVIESSWGIPPPTFTVETTTTSGWTRSGTRTDRSPGGEGGALDYGRVREALSAIVEGAGWKFELEGGALP